MFLIWTAIGALTATRSQFGFGPSAGREGFSLMLACASWFFSWAVLTPPGLSARTN
jgi:hypothetical protein